MRYAAIMSISEAAGDCGATVIELSRRRTALVRQSFEHVLSWFA